MSKFIKLLAPAFVVPENAAWYGSTLGPGSICEVNPNGRVSPIGAPGEISVHYRDGGGNVESGWLNARTPHTTVKAQRLTKEPADEMMGAVDRLRHVVAAARVENPGAAIPLAKWLVSFGPRCPSLLNEVRRELGSKPSPNDDTATIISRVWRLLLPGDAPMSEIEESVEQHEKATATTGDAAQTDENVKAAGRKRAAKKASAKKGTTAKAPTTGKKGTTNKETEMATKEKTTAKRGRKAAGKENATPARSMAITLGTTLVPLLGNREARALATRLKNNDIPTKKDLTKLRDFVNEAAGAAREGDKAPLASKLSSANRLVRRLIRQA
jgi:hypothetical protein